MVEEGYEFFAKRQLVTVFSAPNYCGEFNNAGAMMNVDQAVRIRSNPLRPPPPSFFPSANAGVDARGSVLPGASLRLFLCHFARCM